MSKIFSSLPNTVVAGVALTFVLVAVVVGWHGEGANFDQGWWAFIFRWLHVLSAIMWVGLLYYFNFVQMPSMPNIPPNQRPAVTKVITPAALFWFRWAAMATVATGLILAWLNGYLVDALALGITTDYAKDTQIGIGMWLGLILWFNVWFVIWPAQKVALGIVEADDAAKAKAGARVALLARVNMALTIPLIYAMVSAQNLF